MTYKLVGIQVQGSGMVDIPTDYIVVGIHFTGGRWELLCLAPVADESLGIGEKQLAVSEGEPEAKGKVV